MDSLDVENVPLVNLLDTILTQYNENLRSLLGQLDTEGNRNINENATRSRIDTVQRLVKLDQSLQRLFTELTQHQRRQEEIRSTQQLSIESGKAKLQFINSMLDAKSELEEAIADSEKKLKLAHVAEAASPSVPDIIDYAKKLSKFSTAPPNFNPGSGVPPEPPYPVLLALQGGSLSKYRMHKTAKVDSTADEDNDEGDYGHGMDDDQFDDMDADDLLLSLDLNPDL